MLNDMVSGQDTSPFDDQNRQKQHPESTLIQNCMMGETIKPRSDGFSVGDGVMAIKIGERLDDNKSDHSKRSKPGSQTNHNQYW